MDTVYGENKRVAYRRWRGDTRRMTDDRPQTAADFLRVWQVLAEADNTTQPEQWESQFPELADVAPDMMLEILRELSTSSAPGAKEAAAIYTRFVFRARQQETTDLLVTLYERGDADIKSRILNTIDVIASDTRLTPAKSPTSSR
ncbi:MAG: hypothetical protein ACRDTH_09530 [Pseudonocardiaceae bacterium]